MSMTNAEKFKEDFGFELKNIGTYEDGYYCIDSDADIECKTCPLYEKGCSHVAFINWWNSEYQGEPTIPLSVIEDIKAEITNKADDADKGCKISSDYYIREKLRTIAQTCDEVCKIIDRKVNEVKGDKE